MTLVLRASNSTPHSWRTPGLRQPAASGVLAGAVQGMDAAVAAQKCQQAGAEHGVPVMAAFAGNDADAHAVGAAVDVAERQMAGGL